MTGFEDPGSVNFLSVDHTQTFILNLELPKKYRSCQMAKFKMIRKYFGKDEVCSFFSALHVWKYSVKLRCQHPNIKDATVHSQHPLYYTRGSFSAVVTMLQRTA